jgi:hypothetical protein
MAAITGLRYSKASELVAFSCDDLSIWGASLAHQGISQRGDPKTIFQQRSIYKSLVKGRNGGASELVAFSCDDLSIRVIDLETRKLVREFWGCVGPTNSLALL